MDYWKVNCNLYCLLITQRMYWLNEIINDFIKTHLHIQMSFWTYKNLNSIEFTSLKFYCVGFYSSRLQISSWALLLPSIGSWTRIHDHAKSHFISPQTSDTITGARVGHLWRHLLFIKVGNCLNSLIVRGYLQVVLFRAFHGFVPKCAS